MIKKKNSTQAKRPANLTNQLGVALDLHRGGNTAQAKLRLEHLLTQHPREFDVIQLLASLESLSGNKGRAIDLFEMALKLDSGNASVYLNFGNALNDVGRHADAVNAFKRSLTIKPNEPSVLNNLGIALNQLGQHDSALQTYQQTLVLAPDYPQALLGHGITLGFLERYEEALESFNRAASLSPELVDAHYQAGVAHLKLNQPKQALDAFSKTIRLRPDHLLAHCNQGIALTRLGWSEEALKSYSKAVAIKPEFPMALNNQGVALNDLKRFGEALPCYQRAIAADPNYLEAHYNMGISLHELKRYEEALTAFKAAIDLGPNYFKAFHNMGASLKELKRYDEALQCLNQALSINPEYAESHVNRGEVFNEMDRPDEAMFEYEAALKINPESSSALIGRGLLFADLRENSKAMNDLNRALELDTNSPKARFNRGLLNLRLGHFREGFTDCRARWELDEFREQVLRTTIPSLAPDDRGGKVLLWAEQGLGDEILHYSLLPKLLERGHQITLMADKRLHETLRRSFPPMELVDRRMINLGMDLVGAHDRQAPLGDLGCILGVTQPSVDVALSYFAVNEARKLAFSSQLRAGHQDLVCGLAWKSQNKKIGGRKNLTLNDFLPILQTAGVKFVNLQYGNVEEEINETNRALNAPIHTIADLDRFNDIEGMLALIKACDVVITTSNVTAHLAGSIGKKALILVPYSKGRLWYWHQNDGPSAWYPTLELTSQDRLESWSHPLGKAKIWLEQSAASS